MQMPKSPMSMTYDPSRSPSRSKEAPVQTAFKYLTSEDGNLLQLMTRTNPVMVGACQIAYIFDKALKYRNADGELETGNPYVSGYVDQIMRLSVSMGGKGREEIIQALGEGGTLPDQYYGQRAQAWTELP